MSDTLQQAIIAIKTGDKARAGQLLTELLQADSKNADAWVWLAHIAGSEERRRACLDRALALSPDHPEVHQALLDWILVAPSMPVSSTLVEPQPGATAPAQAPDRAVGLSSVGGASLNDFLLQLQKNYNTLKEREAKYGSTAAPLDLLNQIDDYERAIALTQEAIDRAAPLEELQAEFGSMNLQISTVVFVAQEPPRKPFKGLNPYRGLFKFTEADAQFFFGRNAAIQNLLDTIQYLVKSQTSQKMCDLITVLGPSGSGKSSLVRAGLIPALWAGRVAGSQQWPVKVMLPGPHPLDALAEVFIGQVGQNLDAIRISLNHGEKALHELIVEALTLSGRPENAVFVLIVDQFEELFTLGEDEAERRTFIDQILYATQTRRNRTFVVLTMRSDFYSKLAIYKPLAEAVTRHQMLISPMTEKELREAILLPAEAVGLELEKALIETLVKDTAGAPGVLPLLQHALLELFQRRNGNLLTLEAYNEISGVKGALAHRANSVINELTAEQQIIARRIFLRLVRLGQGAADTRRRASLSETLTRTSDRKAVEAVAQKLADASLIITDHNPETNEMTLEVAHEALIHEWPLLRVWLDKNREALRLQEELSEAAHEWQEHNRSEDYLYQGARLLEAEERAAAHPDDINPLEATFIEASITARDREKQEKEAQRQHELEQAQKLAQEAEARQRAETQRAQEAEEAARRQAQAADRLRKQQLGLIAVVIVAILAAGAATQFWLASSKAKTEAERQAQVAATHEAEAKQAQARAEQEAFRARLGRLAAQVQANLATRLDLALLLGQEVGQLQATYRIDDPVQAEGSVLTALAANPYLIKFLPHHDPVVNAVFSPDGQTLTSVSGDNGIVTLWDVAAGQPLNEFSGNSDIVSSMVLSPQGQTLALGYESGEIILWNLATGQPIGSPLQGHESSVFSLVFSPNSQILASGDNDGNIYLWDVATGQPRSDALQGHQSPIWSLVFSPGSQILASGDSNGMIYLWDVAAGESVGDPLDNDGREIYSLVFSPNNQILISGDSDGGISLWDITPPLSTVADRTPPDPLIEHNDAVRSLAFSPDGQTLASGSADTTIILWQLTDDELKPMGSPLTGHDDWVNSLAFSPDGQTLASAGGDTTLILWNLSGENLLGSSLSHNSPVWSVALSPDGQTLAAGDDAGVVSLWNAATGQPLAEPLTDPSSSVYSVAFSPDGQTLASGDETGVITLWDVPLLLGDGTASRKPLAQLTNHNDAILSLAFSPTGTEDSLQKTSGSAVSTEGIGNQTLASADYSGSILLWDLSALRTTGKANSRQFGEPASNHEGMGVFSIAFSPDGQTLVSGGADSTIVLWDVATGQPRGEPFSGQANTVQSLAFSPNGQILASGGADSDVILWDVADGALYYKSTLPNHKSGVVSLAFISDNLLASGSQDSTIILWDVKSGQAIGSPLKGHEDWVNSLAFSRNEQILVSGSYDKIIQLWNVNPEAWPEMACRRVNRNLSQEEWDQFIGPDIPYQRTCPKLPPGQGVQE